MWQREALVTRKLRKTLPATFPEQLPRAMQARSEVVQRLPNKCPPVVEQLLGRPRSTWPMLSVSWPCFAKLSKHKHGPTPSGIGLFDQILSGAAFALTLAKFHQIVTMPVQARSRPHMIRIIQTRQMLGEFGPNIDSRSNFRQLLNNFSPGSWGGNCSGYVASNFQQLDGSLILSAIISLARSADINPRPHNLPPRNIGGEGAELLGSLASSIGAKDGGD